MGYFPSREFRIGFRLVSLDRPVFFIADIGANHDGDLDRAKALIKLAAESGADAVKFQHFTAPTIVSDIGFKNLGTKRSHQASWSKSVYETYEAASLSAEWTAELHETCLTYGVAFLTSPYSIPLVDEVAPYVSAFKVGSGDITYPEIIDNMARWGRPVLLSTGASDMSDVRRAVDQLLDQTGNVVLMQCNTNYTGDRRNFCHINLNVLSTYAKIYQGIVLGLSDHTPGHTTVLGAVTLGARVIEKHFTDDCKRVGPDHAFSMMPGEWITMVSRTRELQAALGSEQKQVEENEAESVIIQRRAVRASRQIKAGERITEDAVCYLRPCPEDGIPPNKIDDVLGRRAKRSIKRGDHIQWSNLG